MKKLIFTFILTLSTQLWALELKVGDILLQPLACWSCTLIEMQEDSIYSHMGIVIETKPEIRIVEALGSVREVSFKEFYGRTEEGQLLSIRRFQNEELVTFIQNNKDNFQKLFKENFSQLNYDQDFLWDNVDHEGNEKLYCSEMVTKFLSQFLSIKLPLKRMKFDKNRDAWVKYFRGNPPDDMWGNSPADFEKSELFYEVGEL